MSEVLVRCRNVSRTFGHDAGAVVAVHEASCEVAAGDLIALTGPSGSGKSTLLHLLAGLDTPTTGTLTWPALGPAGSLRPGPVAMMFQGPSLLPPLDVLENVALPLTLDGVHERDARDAALRALARVGVAELAAKLPEELSGGQAQRASAARAIAGRPRLILADEPTGQLDRQSGARLLDALLEKASSTGAAVVISTHDPWVAGHLRSRWEMADGDLKLGRAAECSR